MQNGFPARKRLPSQSNINGYGSSTPATAPTMYSHTSPSQPARPYLQAPVQDPDLLPDNSRYGQEGSANQAPPSDALLRGYSVSNAANGVNGLGISGMGHMPATPRASNQLDLNDPVALHLLVETALGDSEAYHVLSFDEADRAKKELITLTPRIESVRKKLALESKVRDAALSLNRLYRRESEASRPSKRRSSSSTFDKRDSVSKTEDEVSQSNKKCAELARELYTLEARQRELQTRLLMHTAGVLQMTHRGPTEKRNLRDFGHRSDMVDRDGLNGRPDSPESIYTYENGRMDRSLNRNGYDDFDERSLYRSPDEMHGFPSDGASKAERSAATEKQFADLGARLEQLNSRMREALMLANVAQPVSPLDATEDGETTDLASVIRQLDTVERNIDILGKGQAAQSQQQQQLEYAFQQHRQQAEEELRTRDAQHSENMHRRGLELQELQSRQAGSLPKLQHFNKQLYGLLNAAAADGFKRQETPAPPSFEVEDVDAEMKYMENAITSFSSVVREMLQRAEASRELQERDAHERGKADQMETVLEGLWSILLAGEEEDRQRARAAGKSSDIPFDAEEPFNLTGFNKRVQWLASQRSDLRAQLDAAQTSQTQEFAAVQSQREAAERELDTHRGHAERADTLERQLAAKTEEFGLLESALQASRDTTAERQKTLQTLREQLVEKDNQVQAREAELASARAGAQEQQGGLEAELVRLTTELAVAKAELDAAYGSRAERQKEAAQAGSQREKQLEDELRSTLQEFEELTRASVDAEKERDKLEAVVDQLREKVEAAEASLSDEKTRWLGVRSPGGDGSGAGVTESTSVTTMRAEFKKMVRETRMEGVKALRAEQDKSKQLEQQLRQLRKEHTSGKSSGLRQMLSATNE